jgi:hypothetical protein
MTLAEKSDREILAVADPIMDNLRDRQQLTMNSTQETSRTE